LSWLFTNRQRVGSIEIQLCGLNLKCMQRKFYREIFMIPDVMIVLLWRCVWLWKLICATGRVAWLWSQLKDMSGLREPSGLYTPLSVQIIQMIWYTFPIKTIVEMAYICS